MKKLVLCALSFFLMIIFSINVVSAYELPGRTDTYVNDYSGLLEKDAEAYIENIIGSVKQTTPDKIEVIVAIFPSTMGMDFNQFSLEYGEKWREIRKGKRDNGIIILIALKERRVNIGVGQNLRGIFTDSVVQDIIQNEIIPEFSQGNLDAGIRMAVVTIVNKLNTSKIPQDKIPGVIVLLGLALAIGFVYFLVKKPENK